MAQENWENLEEFREGALSRLAGRSGDDEANKLI
jgi:hypothetical protein